MNYTVLDILRADQDETFREVKSLFFGVLLSLKSLIFTRAQYSSFDIAKPDRLWRSSPFKEHVRPQQDSANRLKKCLGAIQFRIVQEPCPNPLSQPGIGP